MPIGSCDSWSAFSCFFEDGKINGNMVNNVEIKVLSIFNIYNYTNRYLLQLLVRIWIEINEGVEDMILSDNETKVDLLNNEAIVKDNSFSY